MRWLRIAYTLSRAGRPVLLSATLLGGCSTGGKLLPPPNLADGGDALPAFRFDGSLVRDTSIAIGQDAQVIVIPLEPYDATRYSDARQVLGPAVDGSAGWYPECVDIDAGVDAGLTLPSGQAARVTMEWIDPLWIEPLGAKTTRGRITVAPEIAGLVVGLPTVDVIERSEGSAVLATANLRLDQQTFAFDVNWTGDLTWSCLAGLDTHWVFRTTLRLQCGGQERAVESLTTVALCRGSHGELTWASSGDECGKCVASVCEMAPSPVVAASDGDDLPLGSALGVVVRPIAHVGGAVVLLAEHAPRSGMSYAWQATAGTIEQLDADVVLWRLPAGSAEPQLAQVAVTGSDLATVASYRWDRQAA